MTNEEIANTNDSELIMLYQENDENAKNILFYKYKFIIEILIKKYSYFLNNLNIDYQEIYSECNVGFSDGLNKYKEDREASLPTFITLCIERRIKGVIRKYNRDKYKGLKDTYSLDFAYVDNDLSLMDTISDYSQNDPLKNITEEEGYEELLTEIKNILTKREYEVFSLLKTGLNYQEIAKILGRTPKQIDNTIQRLKAKIRNLLKEREI